MTTDKAIEVANKMQLSDNPLWVEVKRLSCDYEKQIEKMKCCGNCEHFDFTEPNYCYKGVYREHQYVCGKWETKEK